MAGKDTGGFLRCKKAFAAAVDGRQVVTREGDPVPAGSDLVKRFPGFFEGLDEFAERESARRAGSVRAAPVEQATAAPGERRTTRREAAKPSTDAGPDDKTPAPVKTSRPAAPAPSSRDGEV